MKFFIFAVTLASAFGIAVSATAAPSTAKPIPIPESGGYEIPTYGTNQEIWDVYQIADGNLIFNVVFKDHGIFKSDFYDGESRRRMFPDQARQIATSPGGALAESLLPKSRTKLDVKLFGGVGPHGQSVSSQCVCGAKVNVPYSERISLGSEKLGPVDIALFEKHASKLRWYSPEDGDHVVKTNYRPLHKLIYAPDDRGFFLSVGSTFIHFQWDGQAKFLANRTDIIAVPYGELSKIMDFGNSTDQKRDQKRYSAADAYISKVAASQRAGQLADFRTKNEIR